MEHETKIKLSIGLKDKQLREMFLEKIRQLEAGEAVTECDTIFNFQSWEHFISELMKEDPEMVADVMSVPETDRFVLFDTLAGQSALQRILDRHPTESCCE
ncbi:hypothetical protein [Azospirillum doebereinerae]|uniref:Uncharacterized protein n=1 Tax=Azospirillum doebereinerae TaxID=92933 RepID=A0A3S0V318_9PROT|nr:hypothetical protein [Azospirillum doebereinerae]RUQ61415.1 hypothetical protein EJ913_29790 [Azospirillum doebereinerae]